MSNNIKTVFITTASQPSYFDPSSISSNINDALCIYQQYHNTFYSFFFYIIFILTNLIILDLKFPLIL